MGIANANTLVVNSLSDGPAAACVATCRLRDAINGAIANDTIVFDPVLTATVTPNAPAVITMSAGEFVVSKNLPITGPGADLLVLDANSASRVLHVMGTITAAISGLSLRNGSVTSSTTAEVPLLIKTPHQRFSAVCTRLIELHPHELPELVALEIAHGHPAYRNWLKQSLAAATP